MPLFTTSSSNESFIDLGKAPTIVIAGAYKAARAVFFQCLEWLGFAERVSASFL